MNDDCHFGLFFIFIFVFVFINKLDHYGFISAYFVFLFLGRVNSIYSTSIHYTELAEKYINFMNFFSLLTISHHHPFVYRLSYDENLNMQNKMM